MIIPTLPTPIDEFMRLAVAHYYAYQESIGASGDFVTAPEISQMFGEVVGAWVAAEYLARGQQPFYLVELGAGNGTMMSDILRATKGVASFISNLGKIIIVENSPRLRAKQAAKLTQFQDKLIWLDNIQELPEGNLIIVANEFLDALPIKQFQKLGDGFFEVGINFKGSEYNYTHLDRANLDYPNCPEAGIVETCPAAIDMANLLIARRAWYTSALFIDYGYFLPPFTSTLQALKAHKHHDVLSNVGEADITAHVDFGTLAKYFTTNGFEVVCAHQREFLLGNGIELRAKKLISSGAKPEGIQEDLFRLVSSHQMGMLFKVMELRNINT